MSIEGEGFLFGVSLLRPRSSTGTHIEVRLSFHVYFVLVRKLSFNFALESLHASSYLYEHIKSLFDAENTAQLPVDAFASKVI